MIKVPIENFEGERLTPQLQYLIKIFELINNSDEEEFLIDFSNARYCSCFFLGILYSILSLQERKGKKITYLFDGKVRGYLETIKFSYKYLMDSAEMLRELSYYENKNYLPILNYPRQARWKDGQIPSEACINALLNLIFRQTQAIATLQNDINFILSEITDNILQHSEAENGIIFSQYNNQHSYLDIVISDNGIGILNSYKKNDNFSPSSHIEALQLAMEGKSSKEENETRGFGLESSREKIMARSPIGRFLIWSGNSVYVEMNGVKEFFSIETGVDYEGCIVFLRLPC